MAREWIIRPSARRRFYSTPPVPTTQPLEQPRLSIITTALTTRLSAPLRSIRTPAVLLTPLSVPVHFLATPAATSTRPLVFTRSLATLPALTQPTVFAEGIQEEILTRLAKITDLRVISRTSTRRYQSK